MFQTNVADRVQLEELLARIENETDKVWIDGSKPTSSLARGVTWPRILVCEENGSLSQMPGKNENALSNNGFLRAIKAKRVTVTKYAVDGHVDVYNTIEEAIYWQKIQEFSSWARKASFGQYVALSDKPLETLPLWLEEHADKITEFLSDCPKNKNSD
jgi:hypothetical protein